MRMAVSTASEPEFTRNTRFRFEGMRLASFAARSMPGLLA
jgi:hypothetical protein